MARRDTVSTALMRAATIASRYGSMAVQFGMVVLVARFLSKADAGIYLLIYGAVATTSVFAGLGSSDVLVRTLPEIEAREGRNAIRRHLWHSVKFTVGSSSLMLAGVVTFGVIAGYPHYQIIFFALWWISYGSVFYCGQALVALNAPALGAFVWYALNSITLIFTTMPYLLFSRQPNATGALTATVISGFIAMALAVIAVFWVRGTYPAGTTASKISQPIGFGVIVAAARTIQAALFWIPAWAIAFVRGPAEGAVVSTAGRLLIAATAVIAVFRFTIRGNIVAAHAREDWPAIERMSRAAATISTAAAVTALVAVALIGHQVVSLVFGSGYRASADVLVVLLIGAVCESFGGTVDEVVRFSGSEIQSLISLAITATAELALSLFLAQWGPVTAAFAQAIAFGGLYGYLIWFCWRRNGIVVVPYASVSALRQAMQT